MFPSTQALQDKASGELRRQRMRLIWFFEAVDFST
jgi:hypothetical protein